MVAKFGCRKARGSFQCIFNWPKWSLLCDSLIQNLIIFHTLFLLFMVGILIMSFVSCLSCVPLVSIKCIHQPIHPRVYPFSFMLSLLGAYELSFIILFVFSSLCGWDLFIAFSSFYTHSTLYALTVSFHHLYQ